MSTAIVINLLGVGEGGELTTSQEALRLLLGLEYGTTLEAFSPADWLPEATPFDCLMTLLEQCRDQGIQDVAILTSMDQEAWQKLCSEASQAYPTITLRRKIPETISHFYW